MVEKAIGMEDLKLFNFLDRISKKNKSGDQEKNVDSFERILVRFSDDPKKDFKTGNEKLDTLIFDLPEEIIQPSATQSVENASESASAQAPFHHYNPNAWHGRGSAFVLPEGVEMDSITINGKELQKHGSPDKGRQVWTDYNTPGMSGTVEMRSGDKTWSCECSPTESKIMILTSASSTIAQMFR